MLGALGPNGLGAPVFWRWIFGTCLKIYLQLLVLHEKLPCLAGSNPSAWRRWLELLNVRGSRLIWDGGIPRPPAGGRVPLRRFAPCVLRWKTLRVSSAPHPCGFESLRLPTRKRPGLMKAQGAQLPWLGRRDSNPQQPAPKTGVLPLNYVPVWVLHKSNSSSLPNLRGHRKRHRAGVPRASGRRWR